MTEISMKRFSVKNLDCASCAAKTENGLKRVEGVEDAVIDFASLTLHVRAKDIARIVEEVHKIEPDVEIVPKSENESTHHEETGGINFKREVSILIVATALFILQLFFEDSFHRENFQYWK